MSKQDLNRAEVAVISDHQGRTMSDKITRRDFVNGVALGTAALGLTPFDVLARQRRPALPGEHADYPPGLTGMRGSHPGSFETAHAVARGGRRFTPPKPRTGPLYDLVVVGGGISGLAAAKFYRDRRGEPCRILVLDNHDDFGGHARRNEFTVDDRTLLCYGGSQTIDSPLKYSPVARQLLEDIAIDVDRFYDYYDQEFFESRNLGYGIYFDEVTYGVSRLTANPMQMTAGGTEAAAEVAGSVRNMPISRDAQDAFVRLLEGGVDYLEGMTIEEKRRYLNRISYLDFLEKKADVPDSVREILRDTYLQMTSVGWEAASALEATKGWMPGTENLGVQEPDKDDEPYIHHFPDGNAGVARALVRDLIPEAIPGSSMEDLVTARADYLRLDREEAAVQIRLNAVAVDVRHDPGGKFVDVTYVRDGKSFRVRSKHAILACYNNIIPHICSELPEQQAEAIRYATKIPFVKASIAIRSWRAFEDAGYFNVYTPGDVYFKHLKLDFPVSMGDYHYSKGPDEPVVISAWYSPTTRGLPARDQYRAGRARLLEMTFGDFEQNMCAHLDGMLGSHGFDAGREIAGITLNRWPHGYAYEFEGIGVPLEYDRYHGPHVAGRAQIGRISIANSDSEAYAYVDGAIDAADRAVREQIG
jgi:spermidine dehydrogenase